MHGSWLLYPDADRDYYYGIFPKNTIIKKDELLELLVAFFVRIFNKYKIKRVFYENASNALALVAREVGSHFDVKYYGIAISRLPGRIALTDDWREESHKYASLFEKIRDGSVSLSNDCLSYVGDYLENFSEIQPDYMKNNQLNNVSLIDKYVRFDKFELLSKKLWFSFQNNDWNFQVGNPFKVAISSGLRNLKRSIKLRLLKGYFENFSSDLNEKYFLYPLHFHPEASTSVLAREYGSEYEVIRNIAYSLPSGIKLYIKDHVSACGFPTLAFYNKLKKLPNVRVINSSAPTKEMIKSSLGVFTLTSTVGYEALLLGKPVAIFGRVFYEFHDNCRKIETLSEVAAVMKEFILESKPPSIEYTVDFVSAYYMGTEQVSINYNNQERSVQRDSARQILRIIFESQRK
ncbi:hypothetical protein AYJ00_07210 [Shewanella algae]|nr:hypothetical protein AYJ00_07210 [Shewanella algae]